MVHAVLVLVQVLFATLAIAAKLALRDLPPAGLVLLRVGGAALGFMLLLRLARLPGIQTRTDYIKLAVYSLLGVSANQLLYVKGLTYTSAINANILVTTVPVFTLGIALGLRDERASTAKVAGLLLAMTGALGLVGPAGLELGQRHALGNAMILLNALCYACYLVLSKKLLRRYPALTVIAWIFAFGAVGVLPFGIPALAATDLAQVRPLTWAIVLYIILVPTITVYWLSLWALHRTESSLVAMYIYVQPIVTVLIAPLILGERLGVGAARRGSRSLRASRS